MQSTNYLVEVNKKRCLKTKCVITQIEVGEVKSPGGDEVSSPKVEKVIALLRAFKISIVALLRAH